MLSKNQLNGLIPPRYPNLILCGTPIVLTLSHVHPNNSQLGRRSPNLLSMFNRSIWSLFITYSCKSLAEMLSRYQTNVKVTDHGNARLVVRD